MSESYIRSTLPKILKVIYCFYVVNELNWESKISNSYSTSYFKLYEFNIYSYSNLVGSKYELKEQLILNSKNFGTWTIWS